MKTAFPVFNDHAVPLRRCGPLWVVVLFIYSRLYFRLFDVPIYRMLLFVIEPQQCKFHASVMKSNLLDVQRLSVSSFMA